MRWEMALHLTLAAATVGMLGVQAGGSGWSPETRTIKEMVAVAEARASGYYPARGSQTTPDRLTDVSPQVFARYARDGVPVIVSDTTRDWPMHGWTCDTIRHNFSTAKMRREYDGSSNGVTNTQSIGDPGWGSSKVSNQEPPHVEGPKLAPFYWDVKDDAPGNDNDELKNRFRELLTLPYFLPKGQPNWDSVLMSPELWFSAPGAGAKAHADEHCESTMTVQLSGTKRWRLGPMPAISRQNFSQANSLADGVLTRKTPPWQPVYEFDLHPGEALFFPSCFIHESTNVGDDCAASITYQWMAPAASTYWRTHMVQTANTREMQECWDRWSPVATFIPVEAAEKMRGQPTERILKVIGKKVDGDGDGRITLDEIRAFVRGRFWRGLRVVEQVYGQANDAPGGGNPVDEMREYLAEAMFDFHDTDRDGTVTVEEASRVTAEWIAVAQDSEPVREFIDRWKEMEEGGVLECDLHDSIPTWAHSPNGMPTMAAERPGCESAVKTYRTMLGEYGLVGPFEHEEL